MKLIGVIGEPATGKTTLMAAVLDALGADFGRWKFGLLRGRSYPGETYVLGIYRDGERFAGTDRLSMAVQPHAIRFLHTLGPEAKVLFEGDRLTREGFLMAVPFDDLLLFQLVASEEEKDRRHRARGDAQPVTFLRSRRTLIAKITERFPVIEMRNESAEDLARNAAHVLSAVR